MILTAVQSSGIAERIQRSPRHRLRFWSRLLRSRFQSSVRDTHRSYFRVKVCDTRQRLFRVEVSDTKPKVLRLMNGQTLFYYER